MGNQLKVVGTSMKNLENRPVCAILVQGKGMSGKADTRHTALQIGSLSPYFAFRNQSSTLKFQGSHSTWKTWKTWKNESTPGKPGNIMEF